IRDGHVTGVQTCALPISWPEQVAPDRMNSKNCVAQRVLRDACVQGPQGASTNGKASPFVYRWHPAAQGHMQDRLLVANFLQPKRSEERRVGKEWRNRRWR